MRLFLLIISIAVLSGCAHGGNFHPVTAEGASCKAECGKSMALCHGSSYTCDRAAATCMAACQDLDAIMSK